MKAIMISIKPKWCAKIMNGKKTIEVRKNKSLAKAIQKLIDENWFADIYVYCSKDGKGQLHYSKEYGAFYDTYKGCEHYSENGNLNGKVIFKFRCYFAELLPYYFNEDNVCEKSCLTFVELRNYLKDSRCCVIHISDLEIFDEPKELREFYTTRLDKDITKLFDNSIQLKSGTWVKPLTKAPQNMVYIDIVDSTLK